MELEIVAKRENPLLKRTEVRFRVVHGKESTPARGNLRTELAKVLHATRDVVIVDFSRSEFGRATSQGYAKVYKSKEDALRVERKHILVRNGLVEAEKKEAKPKEPKPPPPKREEAPKAAPKEEKKAAPAAEKKEDRPSGKEEKKHEEKKPEAKKGGKEGK